MNYGHRKMPVLLLRSHLRSHWDWMSIMYFYLFSNKTTVSNGSAIPENFISLAPIVSIEVLELVSPIKDRSWHPSYYTSDTCRRDVLRLERFDAGAKQPCPEDGGEEGENNV